MDSHRALLSYNKVCNLEDFSHPELAGTIRDVFEHEIERFGADFPAGHETRKDWEVAMAVRTFRDHGLLDGTREFLGVGAGNEPTIFYLTRFARRVFATDLYLAGGERWDEADVSMLTDPDRHWPFLWDRRRLVVQHMDALNLCYEDNTMDGAFSSSSIEHFGSFEAVRRSASELFRVLKPGGILTLSTELCVEGPLTRWDGWAGTLLMDPPAIYDYIVGDDDWDLVSPLDLYVSDATLATQQGFENAAAAQQAQVSEAGGYFTFRVEHARYPLILMESNEYVWTSVHLALRKRHQ
jgi:SAM-dependent methyltransferase